MTPWNLIPGVLDVHPTRDGQRRLAAGGYISIEDPRLVLLDEGARPAAVEKIIEAGGDMSAAVWLEPATQETPA